MMTVELQGQVDNTRGIVDVWAEGERDILRSIQSQVHDRADNTRKIIIVPPIPEAK